MALFDLVALDDVVADDRADAGDDLFIGDALAAGLVDLIEADRRARLGSGEDFDRDRYQREADLPRPIGACCHGDASLTGRMVRLTRCAAQGNGLH